MFFLQTASIEMGKSIFHFTAAALFKGLACKITAATFIILNNSLA